MICQRKKFRTQVSVKFQEGRKAANIGFNPALHRAPAEIEAVVALAAAGAMSLRIKEHLITEKPVPNCT